MENPSKLEEKKFIEACKPFVHKIENYMGNDPIEPWYKYLLWLDENYETDSNQNTFFEYILFGLLSQYENSTTFNQDRRLIKCFIKYISIFAAEEDRKTHYESMHQAGMGTKVADFYINWAFLYDKDDDYNNAERIYELGISAGAQPSILLKEEKMNFIVSKQKRLQDGIVYKWKQNQVALNNQLNALTTLRIDKRYKATKKSNALLMFDIEGLLQFCRPRVDEPIENIPPTPRNSSVTWNVTDSSRKKNASGRRLMFDEAPDVFAPIPLPPEQNMYAKGIQLQDIIFVPKNQPQSIKDVAPYVYVPGDFTPELRLSVDMVMLMPAPNVSFSLEELKAYKWFKAKKVVNQFTNEQDKYWSNSYDGNCRVHPMLPSKNLPQPEWKVPVIDPDQVTSNRSYKWSYKYEQHYPKDSSEELSFEEIKWKQIQAAKNPPIVQQKPLEKENESPFEIFEDPTRIMHDIKEQARQNALINDETLINDENKPINSEPVKKLPATISEKEDEFIIPKVPDEPTLNITKQLNDMERANATNSSSFNFDMESTVDFELQEKECFSPQFLHERTLVNGAWHETKPTTTGNNFNTTNSSGLGYSIHITDYERKYVIKDGATKHKRYVGGSYSGINDSTLVLLSDEENIGKSIYIKQEDLVFDEEDANWAEVTQFLADDMATNEYKPDEFDLNETTQKLDTFLLNWKEMNPFDTEFQKALLIRIGFIDLLNGTNNHNCTLMNIVQPLKPKQTFMINDQKFKICKVIGTGSFGKVFSAECVQNKKSVALKQQRPPHLWEYYICLEVQERIQDDRIREGFMAIDYALIGNNSTIYVSRFSKHGTLLNVCNKVKETSNKNIDEIIVILIVKQMLTLISSLHAAKIIHADLKPDNFLLMDKFPCNNEDPKMVVQLIDFGQSIDLRQFPSKQKFWSKVKTENFICTEMMEDKPWTYQFDLFCLASTIYTLVAGKYMVVRKCNDSYKPQKLPRYVNSSMWDQVLDTLINIPDQKRMPNLDDLQKLLDAHLQMLGMKKVNDAIVMFNKALD